MNTVLEARIARVARVRGCAFQEAARLVARAAARRRQERRKVEHDRQRLEAGWQWRRDFE